MRASSVPSIRKAAPCRIRSRIVGPRRLPTLQADTLMADPTARRRVAEDVLRFAESLRR